MFLHGSVLMITARAEAPLPSLQDKNLVPSTVSNYKLSPNDLLDFHVVGEPDLDSVIRVEGDGSAIFPLIGSVSIGGRTVGEACQNVSERLRRDGYLVSAQVGITVRGYAKKLFTVLGQVQRPGSYDMEGLSEMTLLQAIGLAGGYTKIANPGSVTVKHSSGGREEVTKYNANKMANGNDKSTVMIHAGDVITVSESLF